MRGVLVAVLAILALLAAAPARAALHRCELQVRCGRVTVPLDRSGAAPGKVRLYVERIHSGSGSKRGVMIALAGGPGQANTDFTFQFNGDLVHTGRDVVTFDQRGTGRSGRLRCPRLQHHPTRAKLLACARKLGPRVAFYRTLDSVEDIEAVRRALGVNRIALYGVSYGTKVALEYAYRHPDRVDELILDSVLPLEGFDVFERDIFGGLPRAYDAICTPRCPGVSGRPYDRLAELVRRGPLRAQTFDGHGRAREVTVDGDDIADLIIDTDLDLGPHREIPGAVESALAGDGKPLARLVRRDRASNVYTGLSLALLYTTDCADGRFPWDRSAPVHERLRQARAAFAQVPDSVYDPFPREPAFHDSAAPCARWPAPPEPSLPGGPPPTVRTLVLSGEQDLRTPLENAQAVAADLPNAQLGVVPQIGHAVEGTHCATRLMRAFDRRRPLPHCRPHADRMPGPPLPTSLEQVEPVGLSGRRGRTLAAVVATVADVARDAHGSRFGGLRGGWARWRDSGAIELHRVRFVRDVRVSGLWRPFFTVTGLRAKAAVRVSGRAAAHGRLAIEGRRVTGRLGGRRIAVLLPSRGPQLPSARRSAKTPIR